MAKVPLYRQIEEELRKQIYSGELTEGSRIPSEAALAAQYNVSRITAKRVLEELAREGLIYRVRGSGSYVSKRKELQSDTASRSGTSVYGLILPFESSLGGAIDIIRGASDYLHQAGALISVQISGYDPRREREFLVRLFNHDVEAVILYPYSSRTNLDLLFRLALERRVVTLIDKKVEGIPFPSVVSNHEQGSFLATQYLIERGHRGIAFISPQGMDENTNIRDRYFGFCRAMYDAGLTVNDELNCVTASSANLTVEQGELDQILDRLLDRREPITAVHAVNDYLAVDLLKRALARNVSVPEQLSIVGFDNLEVTAHTEIPLTTIRQDFYGIGYAAARQASDGVRGKTTGRADGAGRGTPDTVVLPVSLIERDSVATRRQRA